MHCSTTDIRLVPLPASPDVLSDVLRQGAQKLLAQAIEAEVAAWIDGHADCRAANGHRQVVRNGHLPQRTITTGLGSVEVRQPRVHDRRPTEQRIKFTSAILPPYLRKTKSVEELIPWLYLKGVSTGDFSEALAALLGPQAKGLSASTGTRLKGIWEQEYQDWSKRSLADKRYVEVAHAERRVPPGRSNRRGRFHRWRKTRGRRLKNLHPRLLTISRKGDLRSGRVARSGDHRYLHNSGVAV